MKYTELDTLPQWQFNTPEATFALPKWSGKSPPPAVESDVLVTMNGIGKSTVVGYFTESGYLGLRILPHNPPDWYVRQNKKGDLIGCVFGTEIAAEVVA